MLFLHAHTHFLFLYIALNTRYIKLSAFSVSQGTEGRTLHHFAKILPYKNVLLLCVSLTKKYTAQEITAHRLNRLKISSAVQKINAKHSRTWLWKVQATVKIAPSFSSSTVRRNKASSTVIFSSTKYAKGMSKLFKIRRSGGIRILVYSNHSTQ